MNSTMPVRPEPTGSILIPEEIGARYPNVYAVQVSGDSMTGDDIHDGDYVLVDPAAQAHDGDIAVVWVTNWRHTVTGELVEGRMLKRLACNGTVLESSNPAVKPMTLRSEHRAVIQGVAVAVVHPMADYPSKCVVLTDGRADVH